MNDFEQAYKAQDRKDYIARARIGCIVSIPLNLSCSIMDHFMYPDKMWYFLKLRLCTVILTLVVWTWFKVPHGRCPRRLFGVTWFMGPLLMIYWMIYVVNDPYSPYYAGLNIILLAMGLILTWTYIQNLIITLFVLVAYVVVALAMKTPQPTNFIFNNTTFLFLTAAFVVIGSVANERQRRHEFLLRYELDRSSKELEETNRKLIELDRLKSRFFANVSHELRTPLTLMLGPLEILIQRFDKADDDGLRQLLKTMQSNGMRLLKLINDLLDLIRLESAKLQVKSEPIAVDEFISGMVSAIRQLAANKNIKLESEVDPALGIMLGDQDKLEKIALNLMFNAVKFTPDGGHIRVRAQRDGDNFVLGIQDTGIGIAEKNLPFVFDRFWQEDSSSKRKYQGVGIGLALVKELTEAQSGSVSVQSSEGKGATFTVRLPYRKGEMQHVPAPHPAAATDVEKQSDEWLANLYRRAELFPPVATEQAESTTARTQRPLVLICDDEPDMRRFLHQQLEAEYDVVEAIDGDQATQKAQHFLPDVILLDLMMPGKDGLQVCSELRGYPPTSAIPVILLTARADEEAKFDALQIGANDFLAKPFSSTELQARIKNLIESHNYQRKLSKQNKALTSAIEQIKETEMQLVQSEKLASLGRLSAGIIHEINNPLNYTMTGLFALRNKGKQLPVDQRQEFDEILNDVEEGLKRVRNIVSDLRTFTHPGGGLGESVDVEDALAAALRFLSREWKDKVLIEQHIPPGQSVWSNRNKLIHVLVNLLQNSIDALAEKQFEGETKPLISISGRMDGSRSLLFIRDNGMGIDPSVMDKIFDPFFTTKDVGKGMGLGLSICYRIVHNYGGKMSVASERGKFCEFTLDFPLTGEVNELEQEHG